MRLFKITPIISATFLATVLAVRLSAADSPQTLANLQRIHREVAVIAEQTTAGASFAAAHPDEAPTYIIFDGGMIDRGGLVLGSDVPPKADKLAQELTWSLLRAGFSPSTTATPALVITYHWGYRGAKVSPLTMSPGSGVAGEERASASASWNDMVTPPAYWNGGPQDWIQAGFFLPTALALNLKEVRARGLDNRFTAEINERWGARYFLIVTAYDAAALLRGERVPLWRTKVSQLEANENGVMRDVLPRLIAIGARYFGRGQYTREPKAETDPNNLPVPGMIDPTEFGARDLVRTILKKEHQAYAGEPGKDWDESPYLVPSVPPGEAVTSLPPSLFAQIAAYQKEKQELQEELALQLKDRAPGASTREAVDAFNAKNASRITAQERMREEIRSELMRLAPVSPGNMGDKTLDDLLREFSTAPRR